MGQFENSGGNVRIEPLLEKLTSLRVERPPEIWSADADDSGVAALLDAMLSAIEAVGVSRDAITLNVSNVVVEPPDDGEEMENPAVGEYLALTMKTAADLGPDCAWNPALTHAEGILSEIRELLVSAGVRFAYVRRLGGTGSVTAFLPRLVSLTPPSVNCEPELR